MKKGDEISRGEALKRMGGLALGSNLLAPLLSAQASSLRSPQKSASGSSARKPNILWITGEGVPVEALSCYGSRLIKTPHIDLGLPPRACALKIASSRMRYALRDGRRC